MKFNNDFYPTLTEIADLKGGAERIPHSLYNFPGFDSLRTKIDQCYSKYSSGYCTYSVWA